MNKRTRIALLTPLLAGSLAAGPAAAWAEAPAEAPVAAPAAACFVEAAADPAKAVVSGDGFKKGKVFLDQTDGAGGGNATVGEDGKFTSGEVAAGKYRAFQEGGANVTCLGGQQAQDAVNQRFINSERTRGTKEGFTEGKALAQSGVCDAKPQPKVRELQGLNPNAEGAQKAKEAYTTAYDTAFNAALKRYCTD
ncbi:hypothetical protein NRK68_35885 (plasmid) [Streptomyces yangpuensis]|uniref:Uncharacterized protein n=1 Tax=Streptomyces yangpuensis TaxID=1648182 RepID=A0ABY5Q855_9ACTN|nr:hypothetical protein [Streptomyces yangpuensis]MBZ9599563.1 hypothetical protein [Streptomyces erythrochromogenes]UUY52636.1 hypothetical protein NRK68_35885 [Streptomyces yangpuensis]